MTDHELELIRGIDIHEGELLAQYPSFFAVIDLDTGEILEKFTIH